MNKQYGMTTKPYGQFDSVEGATDTPQDRRFARTRRMGLRATGLTLFLAACTEQPADMTQMSDRLTATIAETSLADNTSDREAVDVAAGFGAALQQAVETNEGYRSALSMEVEMINRIGVAESVRRPQVTGNSTVGGMREEGGIGLDETTTGVAAGINVSQLIYDGGESTANVNRATAQALGARATRIVRGNELALEAARAWIDVWQFEARLKLLRERTAEMDTLVGQIERMATNGMLDRAALDSARRQIVDISLEETRLQATLKQARVRFARFFNQEAAAVSRPEELVSLAQARAQAKAWQQAPALQRSAAELIMARSAVAGAAAAFQPKVRLQAGVTSPMQKDESTDTSLGVVLEYTFGDGGRRKSELKAAEARAEASKTQLADAQRSLKVELDAAVEQLASIQRSMPLVAEQIRLSASEAQTSRSQITTGQSNLRQLVEAEIENYRAQDRQIAMRAERQVLLLTTAARTGELSRRLGLSQDSAR